MRQAFAVAGVIGVLAAGAAAQDLLDFQYSNARGVVELSAALWEWFPGLQGRS
jgi:hypothetical protein